MPGPISIQNRIVLKSPPTNLDASHLAVYDIDTKEISIIPKDEFTIDIDIEDVTGLEAALDSKLDKSEYNQHYRGKFPTEVALEIAIPIGNDGDYAGVDNGPGNNLLQYIWDAEEGWIQSGEISPEDTDQLPEGNLNLYFKASRVLATTLSGLSALLGGPILETDTILIAFGKIKKDLSDIFTSLNLKLDKGTYTGNAGDLKTEIDNIFVPNQLISSVPPTRSVNTFTYPATQYQALINKTIRTNPASFVTTIAVASTTDHKRVDLIWFKDNNTLVKEVGIESLTVAPRPEIPSGQIGVPVSFINVFGDVVSDPTPVTQEISIQDYFGIERFKISDYLRFKGATLESSTKSIIIEPTVPLSAFLNITTGDDTMALLENSSRPFKTMAALIAALPTTTGETYTIYITGGNVSITRRMPNRNLKFVAYTNTNLDFTLCKENNGTTEAQYVISNSGTSTWTFENSNISLICDYVGSKSFMFSANNSPILKGNINNLNWKSITPSGVFGTFSVISGSEIIFNNVYDSAQSTSILNNQNSNYNVRIKNFYVQYGRNLGNRAKVTIDNIIKVGASTFTLNICYGSNVGEDTIIGNVTLQGCTLKPYGTKLTVNGTISSTCILDVERCELISGTVISTTYITSGVFTNVMLFKNFTGKVNSLFQSVNGQVIFDTCIIDTLDSLVKRYAPTSTREDVVVMRGFNVINQVTTSANLFTSTLESGFILPITVTDYGTVETNALTYGENVTTIKPNNSFKEKSKEVIIRSKKDLVNRVLSSTTTYIIDGIITLLTGEYIVIPSGGLTIKGYGFDVSTITKNVSGQSIYISQVGGSGNFVCMEMQYNSGTGSVFDITDVDGTHAIELNDVNFNNCNSIGKIKGYRQFTGLTIGVYGCSNGFQLPGSWNGFSLSKLHVRNFSNTGTLFKKDTDTTFSNRFILDSANISGATGIKLLDFDDTIFLKDELLQITNSVFEVNSVINESNTAGLIPNITANNAKCRWTNSTGIQLTAVKFFDMKSPDGTIFRITITDAGVLTPTPL